MGEEDGKAIAVGILHMEHIKRDEVALPVGAPDGTSSHHAQAAGIELDGVSDIVGVQQDQHCAVDLQWVGIADGVITR